MRSTEQKQHYPLTHAQNRIWYREWMNDQADLNVIVVSSETEQEIQFHVLEAAIKRFISQQEAFRIRLVRKRFHEKMEQYFVDPEECCEPIQLLHLEDQDSLEAIFAQKEDFQFDIMECELFKIYFFELGERRGIIAKFHHLIADGWSCCLFLDCIWREYSREIGYHDSTEAEESVAVTEGVYRDYLDEQAYLASKRFAKNEGFWKNIFKTLPEQLPTQYPSTAAARSQIMLDEKQDSNIRRYVQDNKLSMQTFFMTILYIYLSRVERYSLDFLGWIVQGKLELTMTYSSQHYRAASWSVWQNFSRPR